MSHSFIHYAIRLGYTADDAQLALSRLGHEATTNDLLTLVISLHSDCSARREEDVWAAKRRNRQAKKRAGTTSYSVKRLSRATNSADHSS